MVGRLPFILVSSFLLLPAARDRAVGQAGPTSAVLADFAAGSVGWQWVTWDATAGHSAAGCGVWDAGASPLATLAIENGAWSGFSELCFWVQAPERVRPLLLTVSLVADDPATPERDAFESSAVVYDGGWTRIALPLWDVVPQGTPS